MSDPRLETLEPFEVIGLMVRTSNDQEMDPDQAQIGEVWNRFFDGGVYDRLRGEGEHPPLHGVYSNFESDANGPYTLTVGTEGSEVMAEAEGLMSVTVKGGEYLVWEAEGELEEIVPETWEEVWAYFADDPEYTRAYGTDFERYVDGTHVQVFVSVKPA